MRQVVLATVCVAGLMELAGSSAGLVARQREMGLTGRVEAGGRPASDAVVWLDAPGSPRAPEARLVMEQRNMQFTPRVMAAQVGSTIELPNNDRVFHNVFSFNDGKRFDLGLYPTGASKRIKLDRAAVNRLYCNIHPHMAPTSWPSTHRTSPCPTTPGRSRFRALPPASTRTTRGARVPTRCRAR